MDINKAYNLIVGKLEGWLNGFIKLIPNLLLAIIIITIGILLAGLMRKLIRKLLTKFNTNPALTGLFTSVLYFGFIAVVVFVALTVLKLDKAVTSILAGAGILGLALAFAFQDIATNFMSGIFLSFRKPINIGDVVQIKTFIGKVEAITLRDSVIRTFQGQLVIIPNKEVFQNPIENFSLLGIRRMDLTVGISYGEDLRHVKEVTLKALEDLPGTAGQHPTSFYYSDFADSSINFTVRVWADNCEQADFLEVRSEAIIRIKNAFDAEGIMIPFPIRTLDFGIKGGIPLNEVLKDPIPVEKENESANT